MWKIIAGALTLGANRVLTSDPGDFNPQFQQISLQQLKKHCTQDSAWISYKHGVYDVTSFLQLHPGTSQKLKHAIGGPIDTYWKYYPLHQKPHVLGILQSLRIGTLPQSQYSQPLQNPFQNEPLRQNNLKVMGQTPYGAEGQSKTLTDTHLTPSQNFFIRNHLPVPHLSKQDYQLQISTNENIYKFSIEELTEKFQLVTIQVTIQCAGNRRKQMAKVAQTRGGQWETGAIGTAEWTGVRLKDLLNHIGVKSSDFYKHIIVQGHDSDSIGNFQTNIELSHALDLEKDVILAFKMNGEDLSLDHGFPLRLIVPGVVGNRNVKWLKRLVLSQNESISPFHQRNYRHYSPGDQLLARDYSNRAPIYQMPVNSAICDFQIKGNEVRAKGYAYSGGGRGVVKIQLTSDRGQNWTDAEFETGQLSKKWDWTLWEASMEVETEEQEVCVKATDAAGNSQPENV